MEYGVIAAGIIIVVAAAAVSLGSKVPACSIPSGASSDGRTQQP
jgi:hypothetical protein